MPISNRQPFRRTRGHLVAQALTCFGMLAFAGAALAAGKVETPYGESQIEMELHQVLDAPVYYVIGRSGVPGPDNEGLTSNAGFVVTDKGVVVYDALGTPALGYRLLMKIREVTDKPVAIVVAGHYHADHVYGLQAFDEHTDATIWAQEAASRYVSSPGAESRLEQRREALFPWVDENTHLVAPDKTYADRTVLDMGDTQIELLRIGPAHAPDDTIMIVHKYNVVFSGDLIFGGRLPFLGGDNVDTRRWLDGLEYLQSLEPSPRLIIPGHGDADENPQTSIRFTRNYIEFLRQQMGQAADNLVPFADAYSNTDWSEYEDVPTFDAANRGNAYEVYLGMEKELFD